MTTSIEDRLARLEAAYGALQDKEAIREIIHRYCRAADRCDLEAFKACYWPDGRDDHGFFGGGAVEFCDYVIPILKQLRSSIHAISNIVIELNGDRAFVESQWSVVHRLPKADGSGLLDFWHQGRYLDLFEKRGGEWRILHRAAVSDMDRVLRTGDVHALLDQFADPDPEKRQNRGARWPDDPVYRGAGVSDIVRDRPAMADLWGPFVAIEPLL